MYCARTWCRDLYITGFIMYKFKVKLMLVWMRARPLSGFVVVRSAVLLLNKVRCVGLGSVVSCLRGRKCLREYGGGIFRPESFSVLGIYKSWYLLMF